MSIPDPKININRLGSVKKMTEMRSTVWNIDTKFVVFKKTNMRVNLKTCVYSSLEYWVTETYKNDWESCLYQIHRSFKQVGVHGKMTNEINSVDDRCVWLCIRITCSSIGKVLKLPDG